MKKNTRRQRKGSVKTFRFFLFAGTAITFVLILLIIILGDQQFGPVHKVILGGAGPFQKTMTKISDSLYSVKKNYIDLLTVREEKERLWQELQECRTKAYANRGAVALNARLRKLLDFKESSNQPTITAQIIGKDPSLWFRSVIIDRGSSDGVGKGMPVVTGAGIVGQVYASSTDYSKVLLAIAPSSAIDVLLQGSRIRGILKGTGKNLYQLEYILKTAEVFVGDRVVTAGYGGMFPTGLPVGIVSKVTRNRRGMFLEIEVIPAVDFRTLENLLVIEREKKEFN
jgi:rod shape-determining protein MreC